MKLCRDCRWAEDRGPRGDVVDASCLRLDLPAPGRAAHGASRLRDRGAAGPAGNRLRRHAPGLEGSLRSRRPFLGSSRMTSRHRSRRTIAERLHKRRRLRLLRLLLVWRRRLPLRRIWMLHE